MGFRKGESRVSLVGSFVLRIKSSNSEMATSPLRPNSLGVQISYVERNASRSESSQTYRMAGICEDEGRCMMSEMTMGTGGRVLVGPHPFICCTQKSSCCRGREVLTGQRRYAGN